MYMYVCVYIYKDMVWIKVNEMGYNSGELVPP